MKVLLMRKFVEEILFILSLLLLCGCFGGFKRNPVIKHPDASVQIIEVRTPWFGDPQARVAGYDKVKNRMIDLGWVDLTKFEAWTLTKYDWQNKIKARE